MYTSCAMMSSKVTRPIEEEREEVDGAEEVRGAAVPDCLERSYALLRLTAATSVAYMT